MSHGLRNLCLQAVAMGHRAWCLVPRVGRAHVWTSLPLLLIATAATFAWTEAAQPAQKTANVIALENCNIKAWKEVVLGFDRPGILGKLDLQEGDSVKAGDFLASLKDDVARAAFDVARIQAESEVEIVYSELASEVANTEHLMLLQGNLKKAGTIPELEVTRAKLNYDKAIAELNKAKHNREVLVGKRDEAKAQLDTFRLEAPFDGYITRLHLVTGASVKQGDAVIELVDTSKVKVEGQLPVRDAERVRKGNPVKIKIDASVTGAAADPEGEILFVDTAKATPQGRVRVVAEVKNPKNLIRAGQTATLLITPAEKSD
ncbi:MAG: efflux RND transporter periplasmic adaptor subunit [Planctomycetes bacterium]|nr:efflux RND transporter periplasmic adaptor subunit [Planctomycetota bacterium]